RLLGIESVALAVNKLDLVDYDRRTFERIRDAYEQATGFADVAAIPVSALKGDNVIDASPNTPWYDGASLLEWLHDVPPRTTPLPAPFRLPVQWVNRPASDFRGVSGHVAAGVINVGDEVVVQPAGARTRVRRIVTFDGDLTEAAAGQAVTLLFDDDVDAS